MSFFDAPVVSGVSERRASGQMGLGARVALYAKRRRGHCKAHRRCEVMLA